MKIKVHFSAILLVILCVTAFLIPFLSWMLSAFDLPVNSLLSDEGWRWTFTHGMDAFLNYSLLLFVLLLISIGVWEYVLFRSDCRLNRKAIFASLSFACVFFLLLILTAILPFSPLLSITGGLRDSPLIHGLPLFVCIATIISAFIYGLLARCISSFNDFSDFISYGLHRHSIWIVIFMLVSFQYQSILYIIK